MTTLLQDVRYGLRMLRKAPSFTAVAVLTLALGIGANTAIFSLINSTLLRPVPGIAEPNRLVTIGRTMPDDPFDNSSYPNYLDLRAQNTVFSEVAAYHALPLNLSGDGRSERVSGLLVSANYFRVLGVQMARGREFEESEDVLNSARVAVISHAMWVRRFGSDPGMIGRTLAINGQPATIVGIAGRDFRGSDTDTYDIWVPMGMVPTVLPGWLKVEEWMPRRQAVWIMLIARLKPGVTFEQANAETKTIFARLRAAYPQELKDVDVTLMRGVGMEPDSSREMLRLSALLLGVVTLLLLLACANIANLVLARATARRREVAVRTALGASRARVMRQLVTGSMLLGLLGGATGLVISVWMAGAIPKMFPSAGFVAGESALDGRVLGFALVVSLITGVLFGIVPAWQASRSELVPALKEAAALSPRPSRLRSVLVAAQLTISLVLMVGAGLLLRTLRNYNAVDLGFDTRDLVILSVDPTIVGTYDGARLRLFHQQLLTRLQAAPGVESVTFSRIPPMTSMGYGTGASIPGGGTKLQDIGLQFNTVAPNYFEMMHVPVLRGRAFAPQDSDGAPPMVVVNETAARSFWPGEDPIGKTIQVKGEPQPRQVIGVARDTKYRQWANDTRRYAYYSIWQPYPMPQAPTTILLRSKLPLEQIAGAIRREVQALDANIPVYAVESFAEHVGNRLWRERMTATLIAAFTVLALLLAMIGIYGVMAYAVTQRTHEVGIRMALGARPAQVLQLVLRQAIRMTLGGVAAGILAALALTRVLRNLLFGVGATDALTFVSVAVLLAAVALLSSYIPARRATKVDPMVALRYE